MADWNNFSVNSTVAMQKSEIIGVLIIQKWNDLLDAWEDYEKNDRRKGSNVVRARTLTLFNSIKTELKKRRLTAQEFEQCQKYCYSENPEDLIKAFDIVTNVLDDDMLIRSDVKVRYNALNVEEENDAKGL